MSKVWSVSGNTWNLSSSSIPKEHLEPGIYSIELGMFGPYLQKVANKFQFEYKIYGKDSTFINRSFKTWEHLTTNMGILLNGIKGTGKTVTSKLLANKFIDSGVPVLLANENFNGLTDYISSIPDSAIILIDEFEKSFSSQNRDGDSKKNAGTDLLSVMDGVMSGTGRKLFLMTTNNLYLDANLLERPSRIRYIKHYGSLDLEVIMEVVDDILIHKTLRDNCIKFISELQEITIDIVKAVLQEVNIHEESPYNFKSFFNVKMADKKRNIYKQEFDENGRLISETLVYKNVEVNREKFIDNFGDIDEELIGQIFRYGKGHYADNNLGRIVEIMDSTTIKVKEWNEDEEGEDEYTGDEVIYNIAEGTTYHKSFANTSWAI